MILTKVTLFNYGPFCGENTLHLVKESTGSFGNGKNIVLIGGKNGSGKTSLFTAIQVCFYGQSALGVKTSRRTYEHFLREQIHHRIDSLLTINTASIEVDFDFSVCGNRDNYKVKRTWRIKTDDELIEHLEVCKNGKELDTFEETCWQGFVKYLIPQGLLKLFFFDGERINALTKDDDNYELADSIQALFGIDVIRQLRADLRYFERTKLDDGKSAVLEEKLKEIEGSIKRLKQEVEKCDEDISSTQTKIDAKDNAIKKCENELRISGGIIGSSRANILEDINRLKLSIEDRAKELRNIYQKTCPLSYAGEYLKYAFDRIEDETEQRKEIKYKEEFDRSWAKAKTVVKKYLKSISDLEKVYEALIGRRSNRKINIVHNNLGDNDIAEVKQIFVKDAYEQRKAAINIANDIDNKQKKISELTQKLEYIPDDEKIATYIKDINLLSREKGQIEGILDSLETKKRELINEIAALNRNKEKICFEIGELAARDMRLKLVDKTISALSRFEETLMKRKMGVLENNILSCFNNLFRKGDIIRTIKINREDFNVILEDNSGRKINKKKLSEGEKQIYAVSLLSGITKTTKRAFPVLLDTPLGRLDSDHRANIIHQYFPRASHQLIILSTDAEIDKPYFEELGPYISRSYLLDFDNHTRQTSIKEGYFWK